MRRDRTKALGLFEELNHYVKDGKVIEKTPAKKEPEKKPVSDSKNRFLKKLEEGKFNEFQKQDWLHYWQHKALSYGVKYIVGNYLKEYSILGSLMENFEVKEIKAMIDFLWDAEHDLTQDKRLIGVWILSKGWINTVYQATLLCQEGKYMTKDQLREAQRKPSRNREWTGEQDSSEEEAPHNDDKPKKNIRI